jgi:hypothetical protein
VRLRWGYIAAAIAIAVALTLAPWSGIPALIAVVWALPFILVVLWGIGIWRLLERILSELTAIRGRLDPRSPDDTSGPIDDGSS